ncbi:diguanylate cyclase [Sphingomonas sp. ZT3P38]|uniref:sensor domain-containing diguanylate cyclase n=1 Tax=Parasphingomonas zepuensis TaxID=3096161 RepID=UPI002FCAA59E
MARVLSMAPSPAAIIGIGLGYFVLAAGAILLTRLSNGIALLWLANAPLIALLCLTSPRRWPPLIVAAIAGTWTASQLFSPIPVAALPLALANVGEGVLAAWLLRRWGVHRTRFADTRSIALFGLAAGVLAPTTSGLVGAGLASLLLPLGFLTALFDWILGHGVGNLIAAPLAMQLTRRDIDWPLFHARGGSLKAIGAILLLIATTFFVFYQNGLPLLFLPVVPLLIGTFAFQRFGAAVGILIVALIGGVLTTSGHGPMTLMQAGDAGRLQFFQFYLVVLFVTALPVAATLVQRDLLLAELRESEARYRLMTDKATDIMMTLEPDGTIRFVSPAVRELGYFDPADLIGLNAAVLIHPADREKTSAVHVLALGTPEQVFTVEYRATKANGEVAWFESNMRAVRDKTGRVTSVFSVVRDLDHRKLREDELRRAASTDPLTGLLNRRAFRHKVKEALGHAPDHPATLGLLDLDYFKRVNDTYGHAAGDAALIMLADLLRENLRPGDAIGRIGGEEFGLLLAGLSVAEAGQVCERLCRTLAERPVPGIEEPLLITASMGLRALSAGTTIDEAFRAADIALYAAKARGRNRIEIAPGAPA